MNMNELDTKISDNLGYGQDYKQITVHTGGHQWEEIVDVVFCQECDQYHIISEKVPLERSTISVRLPKE